MGSAAYDEEEKRRKKTLTQRKTALFTLPSVIHSLWKYVSLFHFHRANHKHSRSRYLWKKITYRTYSFIVRLYGSMTMAVSTRHLKAPADTMLMCSRTFHAISLAVASIVFFFFSSSFYRRLFSRSASIEMHKNGCVFPGHDSIISSFIFSCSCLGF